MLDEKPRSNFANGGFHVVRKPLHRQQQLMLLRFNLVLLRCSLTEVQELPDLPPKFGEIAILILRKVSVFVHIYIVSRYNYCDTIRSQEQNATKPPGKSGYTYFMNARGIAEHPLARITVEPGKRSGQACNRHLRITVKDVLEYLAGGMSEDQILDEFPDLQREDFVAVYAYAASELTGSHR